jgi:hypothetical protein
MGQITSESGIVKVKNGDFSNKSTSLAAKKKKVQHRRYYLIRRLRKLGYRIETKERSIVTNYSSLSDIPIPDIYYIRQLLKLGFQQEFPLF